MLGIPVEAPFTFGTDLDVQAVTEPAVSHLDGTFTGSLYGVSMDTPLECYVRDEDGESVVYMSPDHRNWVKRRATDPGDVEEESQEDTSQELDGKLILGLIQKIMSGEIKAELAEETETICGQEAYRIDINVSGAILQQLLDIAYSGKNADQRPEGLDLSEANVESVLYVYKKDKLPAKITVDCALLGNAVMQSLLEKQDYVGATDKFTVTATFTEYNTIDSIEIPEEVVNGATEVDESLFGSMIPGM